MKIFTQLSKFFSPTKCLKLRLSVLVIFLIFVSKLSFGQKKISYEVTEETYYEVPSNTVLNGVSSQDLILMKPSKEKYRITREIIGNRIQESKEYLVYNKTEAWMPDINKIVTDNEGTKIYNKKGELIFQRKHPLEVQNSLSDKAKSVNAIVDYYDIPDFYKIKNELALANASFNEVSSSKLKINRSRKTEIDGNYVDLGDKEEIELDNEFLAVKSKVLNSENHEKESEDVYFKKTPNDKNKALKNFERLKREHPNYSDIYKVKYVLYENYIIDDKKVFSDNKGRVAVEQNTTNELSEIAFKVFPNPSQNEISLYYSNKLDLLNVEMINSNGAKVPLTIINQSESEIKLDVSKLIPGIYIVNLQHSKGTLSQKIIKN